MKVKALTEQRLADAQSTKLEQLSAFLSEYHPFDTDDEIFEALKQAYELGKTHQSQRKLPGVERFLVQWEIEDTTDATSARQAAFAVWHTIFGREEPGRHDSCIFTVTDRDKRIESIIDLAQPEGEDVIAQHTLTL